MIGTTDLDHKEDLQASDVQDISISEAETSYMLSGVDQLFPSVQLERSDIISSWSGIRPVIASGEAIDPSKEKREHAIWDDEGLITIAGGKLTTFRLIALDALSHAARYIDINPGHAGQAIFDATDSAASVNSRASRLVGRYGAAASRMDQRCESVAETAFQWSEIEWALQYEAVFHLDDLLLRRTRLGNLLPNGASELFDRLEPLCKRCLNWDEARWSIESERYLAIYQRDFSIGGRDGSMNEIAASKSGVAA